jgi:hypothetical protein
MQAASGRCRCSTLVRCHRAAPNEQSVGVHSVLDRRQLLAALSAALAVSHGRAASADVTDEEAVANKELVKEVVDKTKPAAPGEGPDMHQAPSHAGDQARTGHEHLHGNLTDTRCTVKVYAGMSVYFGLASPPTSYGGYGGNAAEDAKYVPACV